MSTKLRSSMSTEEKKKRIKYEDQFRELTKEEQKSWFMFYVKHQGSLLAMSKDPEFPSKHYNFLRHCRDKYDWSDKYHEKLRKDQEKWIEGIKERLGAKKYRALERFYELLEDREIEAIDKDGKLVKIKKKPTYKELEAAIKAIKTELGEPSNITKNESLVIDPETEQMQNQLHELLTAAHRTAVQGQRETSSDSTEIPGPVSDDRNEKPSEG